MANRLCVSAMLIIPMASANGQERSRSVKFDRDAKLYNLMTGDVSAARYKSGKGRGPIEIELSQGNVVAGEYAGVSNRDPNWGKLFGAVGGKGVNVRGLQRGSAVAAGSGVKIECEFVTNAVRQQGFGFCKDNNNGKYRLMF